MPPPNLSTNLRLAKLGVGVATNLKTTRVQSEPHLNPGALKHTASMSSREFTQQDRSREGWSLDLPHPQLPEGLFDSICAEINDFQQVIPGAAQELRPFWV